MTHDNGNEPIHAGQRKPPEAIDRLSTSGDPKVRRRPRVISIKEWLNRPPNEAHDPPTLVSSTSENTRPLTRDRKQAVLLKAILSDSITDKELDTLLGVFAPP